MYVGPSAALNVVGAIKLAKKMGPGNTIVTVLCDGGGRYKSKIYTESWLKENGFELLSRELRIDSIGLSRLYKYIEYFLYKKVSGFPSTCAQATFFFRRCIAITPSSFPSSSSRLAPPPVET